MKKINISNDEMMVFLTKAFNHTKMTFVELFDFQINIEEIKNHLEFHRKRLVKVTNIFNTQLRSGREEIVIKEVKKDLADLSAFMDEIESGALKRSGWISNFDMTVRNYAQYSFVYNYLTWLNNYLRDKENLPSTFTNIFDLVDANKIYNHFKEGLVDAKMLTLVELEKYLKAAFEDKKPPQELFTLKDLNKKGDVNKVFYLYYKTVAGKPHGRQKEYSELLGEYFIGFKTSTVSSNFSKSLY